MNRVQSIDVAVALLKTALEAGWLRDETGANLANEVGAALEILADRLQQIDNK